jgi:hypothetical protein
MSDLVIASGVSGGFAVIVAMIGYLAHTNKREHAENGGKLDQLLRGHDRIETKIDTHINDHAKGDV